jgi:hypothetical protein
MMSDRTTQLRDDGVRLIALLIAGAVVGRPAAQRGIIQAYLLKYSEESS